MSLEKIINLLPEIRPAEEWPYIRARPYKSDFILKTNIKNWVMLRLKYDFFLFKKIPRYPDSLQAFHAFYQEKMDCEQSFKPHELYLGNRRIALTKSNSMVLAGIDTNECFFYFSFHKSDAPARSVVREFTKLLNGNYAKM